MSSRPAGDSRTAAVIITSMRLTRRRSATAEGAAAARAAAARQADPAARNPDHLAERLIGRPWQLLVRSPLRPLALRLLERSAPGMLMYHLARTRRFDALLEEELGRGLDQLVILSAGLDTRAHRFRSALGQVAVFEVDHPFTSAWKQRQVARRLPDGNEDVRYVPVDLAAEELLPALAQAGFRHDRRTFVLWEGATMYIPAASVSALLRALGAGLPDLALAFDYLYRSALERPDAFPGGERNLQLVRRTGEPYVFGLDPDEVGAFLDQAGFQIDSNLDAGALAARHLGGPDGTRPGRMLSFVGIVQARAIGRGRA
jgi:methyltransferase (TIGR00027 family)